MEYGLCKCGCGEAAEIAKHNDRRKGHVKGEPTPYKRGHRKGRPGCPEYVVDENGCWVWQRCVNTRGGYGRKLVGGRWWVAHRWYYERVFGPVPEGLELDHLCRNRLCVNPEHLEAVTRQVNIQRGAATKLTKEQVLEIRRRHDNRPFYGNGKHLAAEFGISMGTLYKIVERRSWTNI
jgi:hypothetical protein